MYCFKKIAVIIQIDKNNQLALDHAVDMVKRNGGELHVLCVTQVELDATHKVTTAKNIDALLEIDCQIAFINGVAAVNISRYAISNKIDLIILQPDAVNPLVRFFYGSLSLSLLRKAPCPVWIVKQPLSDDYQRIIIAVDPIMDTVLKENLNKKLIEVGTSFAKKFQAECFLVAAWELPEESSLRSPFLNLPAAEIEMMVVKQRVKSEKAFAKLKKMYHEQLVDAQPRLLHGSPGMSVAKFVSEYTIDMVILGSVARSGIKGFVIGNTAETIINQIDCSLMVIKPDGFISPVAD